MKIGTTKNIKDLAPTLAEKYTEEEVDKNIHEEYNKRIECYKNIMGSRSKYFFGSLHDAKIFSLKVKSGNLHLTLNDCATYQFSHALIEKMKLKINYSKLKFPLEIITEKTSHVSLNTVDGEGRIYNEKKFGKVNEYLYEEIIEWNDRNIEIAFDLFSTRLRIEYLLLLSCEKMEIIENQYKHWQEYFGVKYNKYYDEFIKERNKGAYLSDYSLCVKFMDKIVEEGRK
jgi:hypothetical protein